MWPENVLHVCRGIYFSCAHTPAPPALDFSTFSASLFLKQLAAALLRCTMSSPDAGVVQSGGIKAGAEINTWADASQRRVSLSRLPSTPSTGLGSAVRGSAEFPLPLNATQTLQICLLHFWFETDCTN